MPLAVDDDDATIKKLEREREKEREVKLMEMVTVMDDAGQ